MRAEWRCSCDPRRLSVLFLLVSAVLLSKVTGYLFCTGHEDCHLQDRWQPWTTDPTELGELARKTGRPWGKWLNKTHFHDVESQWIQRPPTFKGKRVQLEDVAGFVVELLEGNAFETWDNNVPWLDFSDEGSGKVVALSQRQLAYIVANILMGNSIPQKDGLTAALHGCSKKQPAPQGYLMSLLSFLAVLSQELADGDQGKILIAATPGGISDVWKTKLMHAKLQPPTICAKEAGGPDCGLDDYLSGDTQFQAITSIAKEAVGGLSDLCDVAQNQDESLPVFYSEVLAFHFFTGESSKLPLPWTLLGARRYLRDISGQSGAGFPFYGRCGGVRLANWLNEKIGLFATEVTLDGGTTKDWIAPYAFVAVDNKGAVGCKVNEAVQNKCIQQRSHLDVDMSLWFQAYDPDSYNDAAKDALRKVILRIGSGPWGAGRAYGDSQQLFLTTWLATSVLGGNTIKLDYYIYSKFCENPGNQCYLLASEECQACLLSSSGNQYPLPASQCPKHGAMDMIFKFGGGTGWDLFQHLSSKNISSDVERQVFDHLAAVGSGKSLLKLKKRSPPNGLGMIGHERWSVEEGGPIHQAGGWCIDAPDPLSDGSAVHLWQCYKHLFGQQYTYFPSSGHIRNAAGMCLDTEDPSVDGSSLMMAECSEDSGHQQWKISDSGHVENREGKCIDAPQPRQNGGVVHLWKCFDKLDSQMWKHSELPSYRMRIRDSRGLCLTAWRTDYVSLSRCEEQKVISQSWFLNRSSGKLTIDDRCLEATHPHKIGAPVALKDCKADSDQQEWTHNFTTGYFQNSLGMCLDAPEPDTTQPAPLASVHIWPCFGSLSNQQWADDDAHGLIRNRHGFCLHAAMPSMKGSSIWMAQCNKHLESQHWHLVQDTGLIKSQYGSCLESFNTSLGSSIQVGECNAKKKEQQWTYDDTSGSIRHPKGLCIDTPEPKKEMGLVHLWTCFADFPSQEWI